MPAVRQVNHYELTELIDQGELLSVYRARDTQRNQPVILKLLNSDDAGLVERFRQEAKPWLGLHLPHMLPVRQIHTGRDACYLVINVPEGQTLEQRIARSGPLDIDDVLSVVAQVAEALDYVHKQDLVHGDVRPANIYLADKTVTLANIRLLEAVGATPVYMAPEQLDPTRAASVDQRSDVYALGCVIYEMLTGRPPFEGSAEEVSAAQQTQRPAPPRVYNPDLLPVLDAILLKALAKPPSSRYQTAGALTAALHEAVQDAQTRRMAGGEVFGRRSPVDTKATRPVSVSDDIRRVPVWVWIGAGILIAVIVAAVILLATG